MNDAMHYLTYIFVQVDKLYFNNLFCCIIFKVNKYLNEF